MFLSTVPRNDSTKLVPRYERFVLLGRPLVSAVDMGGNSGVLARFPIGKAVAAMEGQLLDPMTTPHSQHSTSHTDFPTAPTSRDFGGAN